MPKLPKKQVEPVDPEVLLREYRNAQALVRQATKRQDDLKGMLVDIVQASGEPDDKGNLWVELPSGAALKYERRVRQEFDSSKAQQIAAKHGVDCTETIVVFSEDKFLAAGYEKAIPDKLVRACYSDKETWAFTPKDAPKP